MNSYRSCLLPSYAVVRMIAMPTTRPTYRANSAIGLPLRQPHVMLTMPRPGVVRFPSSGPPCHPVRERDVDSTRIAREQEEDPTIRRGRIKHLSNNSVINKLLVSLYLATSSKRYRVWWIAYISLKFSTYIKSYAAQFMPV